jgi:hypothetical protein
MLAVEKGCQPGGCDDPVGVLAQLQGGVAIGQTTKSLTPLEIALQAALDHLHTHETVSA